MLFERIKELCKQRGVPFYQFEIDSGVGRNTVTRWEKSPPSIKKVQMAAAYFGITVSELLGETKNAPGMEPEAAEIWRDYSALDDTGRRVVRAVMRELGRKEPVQEPIRTKEIPMFGQRFAAGRGEPDFGVPWEKYTVPADSRADFAIPISGNSMEPYLPDGSIALCRMGAPVDGDVAALIVDGVFLVKQVCEDSFGNLYLFALNRERKDADDVIMRTDDRDVRCLGTVIMDKRVKLPNR